MATTTFMDAMRELRRDYRGQWRAARRADQVDEGKRIIASTRAGLLKARPEPTGRGYSFEQGSTIGREAMIANGVKAADAAAREADLGRFWAAGDALFALISGPVDREDRRAGRPVEDLDDQEDVRVTEDRAR